jgi:hypothetical protein
MDERLFLCVSELKDGGEEMAKWEEIKGLELDPNHQWRVKKGYKQFVANRGAVSFQFPRKWIDIPEPDGVVIQFFDKNPPSHNCVLSLTCVQLPHSFLKTISIVEQLQDVVDNPGFEVVARGSMFKELRDDFDLVWTELCLVDPEKNRDFISRFCMAQSKGVQALIIFKFWASKVKRFDPIWDDIRRSLMLERYIKDPRMGR